MIPVLNQRSIPKSNFPSTSHLSQFSISSVRSVKSVGSSIIDTDFENNSYNSTPVPLAITAEDDELSDDASSTGHNGAHSGSNMMDFLTEFKNSTIFSLSSIQEQQKRDMDRLSNMIQNESNRRQILEGRLHAQLLLQAETMVAMEVKLLRLEAKVEKQEGHKRKSSGGNSSNLAGNHSAVGMNVNSSSSQGLGHGSGHGHAQVYSYMNLEGRTGSIVANETIDEEESDFGIRDIKEIRVRTTTAANDAAIGMNDAASGITHATGTTGQGHNMHSGSNLNQQRLNASRDRLHSSNPTNIVMSSGASLASGVTALSFLEETHGVEDQHEVSRRDDDDGGASARSSDGDVEDEGDDGETFEGDGSASTPTQGGGGSRREYRFSDMQPVTNLESILLNPINSNPNDLGMSTRAVRGDYDGSSSLATSMTNTTVTSTIVTATTRGNESTRLLAHDAGSEVGELAATNSVESGGADLANSTASMQRDDYMLGLSPEAITEEQERPPRNESPLTVQSAATETRSVGQSVASEGISPSIGTSVISTAAIAPARSFRARREAAARFGSIQDGRSMANRVVSFTSDQVFSVPPEMSEACDSITMPDEFDNMSDVADEFASRARLWRDEYEARLDAIQKRWS